MLYDAPANSKADIEYLPNAVNLAGNYESTASLGAVTNVSTMACHWYRSSTSVANADQHPSLCALLDADGNLATVTDRGRLVFERV